VDRAVHLLSGLCRLSSSVCCTIAAKINEETGEDMDDNVYFDECDVDDDDIDEV